MVAQSIFEEYPEPSPDGIEFLRGLQSRQLRRMALPLIRATAISEAGPFSLSALVAIDQVLAERESAAA